MQCNLRFIAVLALIGAGVTRAQAPGTRFVDPVFQTVNVRKAIEYRTAQSATGIDVALLLDFYEPADDSATRRPLLIFMHGGGFFTGSRESAFAAAFCGELAQRGYAVASIDYRLGVQPFSRAGYTKAIYRAVQDAHVAVRYMKANSQQYRIDPERVFLGGESAGGVTSVHAAYWNPDEIPTDVDTAEAGPLSGGGAFARQSSSVRAIVNLWGAIGDTLWIDPREAPVVSVHGDEDLVVPIDEGGAYQIAELNLFGSRIIHRVAERQSIRSRLKVYEGLGHGHSPAGALMDTTIAFVLTFLFQYAIENSRIQAWETDPARNVFTNVTKRVLIHANAPKRLKALPAQYRDALGRSGFARVTGSKVYLAPAYDPLD